MLISHQKLSVRGSDIVKAMAYDKKSIEENKYLAKYLPAHKITWTSSARAALKHILLNESSIKNVALPAFTCHVVSDAIKRAGKNTVYFDAAEVPTPDEVKSIIENKKIKIDALVLPYNFGFMADTEKISALCRKNNILLIEDCAQALGAEFGGKKAGTFGDYAFYSFGISKNIGFIGGAIASSRKIEINASKFPSLEKTSRILETLIGSIFFNKHIYPISYKILKKRLDKDYNDLDYKLPDYCKAVVIEIAKRYDQILKIRRENAALCMEELDGIVDFVRPINNSKAAWLYFVLMCKDKVDREKLRKSLFRENVDVQPLMTFRNLAQNKKFANAERMQDSHLIFAPYRSRDEIEYIIKKIKKVCRA